MIEISFLSVHTQRPTTNANIEVGVPKQVGHRELVRHVRDSLGEQGRRACDGRTLVGFCVNPYLSASLEP